MTTMTRRAALGGIVAIPATINALDDGEASTSPLEALVAEFRAAEAELIDADEREAHLDEIDLGETPLVTIPFMPGVEFYFARGIEASFQALYGSLYDAYGVKAARPAIQAIKRLEEASLADFNSQNAAYWQRYEDLGKGPAERATWAAVKRLGAAVDALADYRPQTVSEVLTRGDLFAGFVSRWHSDVRLHSPDRLQRMLGSTASTA